MASNTSAGYSGTPLAKKLGIKELTRVFLINAPDDYETLLKPLPAGVAFDANAAASTDVAHVFVTKKAELARHLAALRKRLRPDASVWVSWPKKASNVPTDITGDVIREVCLPMGWVDIKVCAVTDVWSGLKLVVRKELR
ncbi:MAG: hypothetical protein ABI669_06025 [Usitatibacter sp.]